MTFKLNAVLAIDGKDLVNTRVNASFTAADLAAFFATAQTGTQQFLEALTPQVRQLLQQVQPEIGGIIDAATPYLPKVIRACTPAIIQFMVESAAKQKESEKVSDVDLNDLFGALVKVASVSDSFITSL